MNEDGVPTIEGISPVVMHAIEKAMQPRRKGRPQGVKEFLALLDGTAKEDDNEDTVLSDSKSNVKKVENQEHRSKVKKSKIDTKNPAESEKPEKQQKQKEAKDSENKPFPKWIFVVSACIAAILITVTIPILFPEVGKVSFDSEPQGAEVWLDGEDSGEITPCTLSSIPFGPHYITFKLDGYCDYTDSIMVIDRTPICYIGTLEGYEWVDLGLSVKWATCNIGASMPEDYGYYFAWGETSPKNNYSWSTLKYCSGDDENVKFSKYVVSRKYGTVDNKRVLELSDDAAHINWGGNWRMPTDSEFEELENKCTWSRTKSNGVNGFEVKSKINGKSIFLPYAGEYREMSLIDAASKGHYWSSSLPVNFACSYACGIVFYPSFRTSIVDHRYVGKPVRPVCPI